MKIDETLKMNNNNKKERTVPYVFDSLTERT